MGCLFAYISSATFVMGDRVIVMGRGSKKAPEAGDWWSVIEETFNRLGDEVGRPEPDLRRAEVVMPASERVVVNVAKLLSRT